MEKEKLLVIELEDIYSVPKLFYKGEEIDNKQIIKFDWRTADEEFYPVKYYVKWFEIEEDGKLIKKTIGDELSI